MKPEDPRVLALAAAIVALIDGVVAEAGAPSTDELVPLTAKALAARGLEHRPIVRLAETGELRTVRIGRRRYTRASWLAELAEGAPAAALRPRSTAPMVERDELVEAVKKMAVRRAARDAKRATLR